MRFKALLKRRSSSRTASERSSRSSDINGMISPLSGNPFSHTFKPHPYISSKYEGRRWSVILMTIFVIILIWIYHYQYQFIPILSDESDQYESISWTNYKLFSKLLHKKCNYAYSHQLSDIGDIKMQYSDTVPFLQFLTFSDYGIIRKDNKNQQNVQSLLKLIKIINSHLKIDTHFMISAGDHFYHNDVNDARHYRWNDMFHNFVEDKVFLSTVGNKDWVNITNKMDIRNIEAQLQRTYWSPNWCLPKLYFTLRFIFQDQKRKIPSFNVRFIALDTTSYLRKRRYYSQFEYIDEQYEWLQNTLNSNKNDDWIIVFGHHPFESAVGHSQKHKDGDPQESHHKNESKYTFQQLRNSNVWKKKMEKILKLLLKYDNVMLYISGHHHIWRVCNIYDKTEKIKLVTMITGSTGRHDHYFNKDLPLHMVGGGEEESFGKITIYRNMMRVRIIDKSNKTLFTRLYYKQSH